MGIEKSFLAFWLALHLSAQSNRSRDIHRKILDDRNKKNRNDQSLRFRRIGSE
jgi:hypothetical protein